MTAGPSLRARLLLGALLWLTVALAGSWFALTALFRDHLNSQLGDTLTAHLDQITANLVFAPDGALVEVKPLSDPRFARPYSGLYWQADRAGVLHRSRSLWDRVLALPADAPADGELHRHLVVGPRDDPLIALERTVRPLAGDALRLAVAVEARTLEDPVGRFGAELALSLVMIGLGILLAALAQVTVGLQPFDRLRVALGRLRRGSERRIVGRWPGELVPLIEDLNALLQADAQLLARTRAHAGNLAHALKTPLAVVVNRVAGLPEPVRAELTPDLEAIRRQIDYHLARARVAGPPTLAGLATPIRPHLEGLVRTIRRAYPDRELVFAIDADPDLTAPCEGQDFTEIVGNLLDNAAKWAAGRVLVSARADGAAGVALTVEDDGPGLDPAAIALVREGGQRFDATVSGSGLGLAIVRDILALYRGRVDFDRGAELGGLRVTVTLPAASSDRNGSGIDPIDKFLG